MGASIASTCSRLNVRGCLLAGAAMLLLCAFAADAQSKRAASPQREEAERQFRRPVARPNPPRMPAATLFFCTTNDVQCRTSITDFDLDAVRDLFVFAAWRNLSGEHTQQLRFVLPDGNTYQAMETKFTVDATSTDTNVQVAARSREEKATSVAFAVAGTHITQRSLSGTWTVELYLDGKLIAQSPLTLRPRANP